MQLSKSVPGSDLGPITDLVISNSFDSVMVGHRENSNFVRQ